MGIYLVEEELNNVGVLISKYVLKGAWGKRKRQFI